MKETIIVVKQPLFKEITDTEVLATLNVDRNTTDVIVEEVRYKIIPMEEIDALDNAEAKSFQKSWVDKTLKPLLEKHPGALIYYFGATTIPLAVHLGFCIGGWQQVEVFNWDRFKNTWAWEQTHELSAALAINTKFVSDTIEVSTEVLFKVEASFPMQSEAIKQSLGTTYQTVSLALQQPGKQAFKSGNQAKEFSQLFSQGLDNIATKIPNADKIHLIISAPVGVCFLLGTRFNPTMTRPVVLYQFNTNKTVQYEEIFILQEDGNQVTPIGQKEQEMIDRIRQRIKTELEEKIVAFADAKKEESGKYSDKKLWIESILPAGGYDRLKAGYWLYQPLLNETILTHSTLSAATDEADKRDGFYIEDNGSWQLTDRFIYNISARMGNDEEKTARALRMFMLHEAFHIPQGLTNRTANAIGRFPRILEEADFIADVWTFFHEYSFSKMFYRSATENPKTFFKSIIQLAIETMWSFVELSPNNNEIQVRSVNRFLIWYWVFNMIDDPKCQSIEDIVNRLAIKPILEIKGLDIKALAQRVIYKLNNPRLSELEIGYSASNGKIYRMASAAGLDMGRLVEGFRERASQMVHDEVKTFYHIIGSQLPDYK